MKIFNILEITKVANRKAGEGVVVSAGVTFRNGRIHFFLARAPWDEELVERLLEEHTTAKSEITSSKLRLLQGGKEET